MLLFRSEEHAREWYGGRTGPFMTLQQQWDLARLWYAGLLSPTWRRPTPEEAEEAFARCALTGAFWRLTG